jgi:beta-N-acetylhexosaminidase
MHGRKQVKKKSMPERNSVEKSLSQHPFYLSRQDLTWVQKTRDSLSAENKVRQLFLHICFGHDLDGLLKSRPCGFHPIEKTDLAEAWNINHRIISECEVPPFISSDLEGGGNHASGLSDMPNQLAFAAVRDLKIAEKALQVIAAENCAIGVNYTFTPCVDINHATTSAIVGTRSYGSNLETISDHAAMHMRVLQSHGIATAAKHWPGEGFDARDQHLVTTINPLSTDEWSRNFGALYSALIKQGLHSVMSAHIALPSFAAKYGIPASVERYRPASVSNLLNQTLLRGELGFNGLIVSDATPMAGLTSWSSRAEHVPMVIESGCDIFLFTTNVEADFQHMMNGLRSGALSEQRLEDAVTRILGLKAALGLHRKSASERIKPLANIREMVASTAHREASKAVADASITLVKDTKSILPLNLAKHKRISWIGRPSPGFLPGMPDKPMSDLRNGLQQRGFIVTDFDGQSPPKPENTDCLLYVLPTESSLGKSRIFLDWAREQSGLMNLMQRYWNEIPTVMVSLGHPYYLYDAPRVPCYINAYSNTPCSQNAVLERLVGNAPFVGQSPIDPFAGAPDAQY